MAMHGADSSGLGPARLRIIKELVHAKMEDELRLCEMAQSVELTPAHFARMSTHHVHSGIENWLTIANRHILDAAELGLVHQFHQEPLSRAQILSPQERSER
jgi:hypothetical protein